MVWGSLVDSFNFGVHMAAADGLFKRGTEAPLWAVGELLAALSEALQAQFNPVRVVGEVSGYVRAASGHSYFTLKDERGQLRCALFKRAAAAAALDWRDGVQVELQGRIDIYGARGELQLIVEAARLAGQGGLFEQFMRLKAQLQAEGWFDPARKRPLPAWPTRIGVVTSPDAAALRDVITTLSRRVPHLPVRLYPARVQGEGAPQALCQALQAAAAQFQAGCGCEVLLLVRGGGSLEDLWAFNDPALVRQIAQAPMPVICGVGHETDFTLADFVADLRAPTPTAAAELCAPERSAQLRHLERCAQRLQQGVAGQLEQQRQRLQRWQHSWQTAAERDLERRQLRLDHQAARLQALDPHGVLQRGYALLSDASGRPVLRCSGVQVGQALRARLADGQLDLTVSAAGN